MGKWKSSGYHWTWAWFTEGQCMVSYDEKQSYRCSLLLKNLQWLVTLFWQWQRTLLCIMLLWEQFSCQMMYHPISTLMSCLYGQGISCSLHKKRGTNFLTPPLPSSPDLTTLDFFLWVFVKYIIATKYKMWMSCTTESSELYSALRLICLSVPVQELHIFVMCVVPLMVPYWVNTLVKLVGSLSFYNNDTWYGVVPHCRTRYLNFLRCVIQQACLMRNLV